MILSYKRDQDQFHGWIVEVSTENASPRAVAPTLEAKIVCATFRPPLAQ